jgi:hypothetical protein
MYFCLISVSNLHLESYNPISGRERPHPTCALVDRYSTASCRQPRPWSRARRRANSGGKVKGNSGAFLAVGASCFRLPLLNWALGRTVPLMGFNFLPSDANGQTTGNNVSLQFFPLRQRISFLHRIHSLACAVCSALPQYPDPIPHYLVDF